MTMFDRSMLDAPDVHDSPFRWIHLQRCFIPERATELAASFPSEGFAHAVGNEGHYELWDQTLVNGGVATDRCETLAPPWQSLVDELRSDEYRAAIARLFGIDLSSTELKLRLCVYAPSCWMLPHTDRPDRVVTQTIYLTPEWEPRWGGALRILRSSSEDDVAHEVAPSFNSSVIFMRSDSSFHAVSPVIDPHARPRRSILSQFIRAGGES